MTQKILLALLSCSFIKFLIVLDWSTSVTFLVILATWILEPWFSHFFTKPCPPVSSDVSPEIITELRAQIIEAVTTAKEARDLSGRLSMVVGIKGAPKQEK